jgi:hypothetical protein
MSVLEGCNAHGIERRIYDAHRTSYPKLPPLTGSVKMKVGRRPGVSSDLESSEENSLRVRKPQKTKAKKRESSSARHKQETPKTRQHGDSVSTISAARWSTRMAAPPRRNAPGAGRGSWAAPSAEAREAWMATRESWRS